MFTIIRREVSDYTVYSMNIAGGSVHLITHEDRVEDEFMFSPRLLEKSFINGLGALPKVVEKEKEYHKVLVSVEKAYRSSIYSLSSADCIIDFKTALTRAAGAAKLPGLTISTGDRLDKILEHYSKE